MKAFPLWAERLYNHAIALDRFKNDVICEFAEQRLLGLKPERITATSLDQVQIRGMADDASYNTDAGRKPFLSRGQIAVVPVRGTLVHKGDWIDAESGLLGYNRVLDQMRAAVSDGDIKGVFMPYDSGGGETAGMWAAAEEIASMTKAEGGKPIFAYLDERACSAAYVLCSASDKIFGRRESMGGSIAAIVNMLDTSKAYEKLGLKPVVVRASWADRKARGQPGEPIDDELVSTMQGIVDNASEMIVEFVAAMRDVTEQSLRDLRGEMFLADDLLELGLIDGIASEREAWAMLEREIAGA